jgi:hypothetical protein
MTPQHRQHWQIDGKEYRIMTVTESGAVPVSVVMSGGFAMPIKVWGTTDQTQKLYREITPPNQKPRPWAGVTPEVSATTWVANAQEPWVVFYRCDEGGVYWGLPISTFTETFQHVPTPAPTFQS